MRRGGACVDAVSAGQLIRPYSLISFHCVCVRAKDVRHYGRCIYACNLHPPLISSSASSVHRQWCLHSCFSDVYQTLNAGEWHLFFFFFFYTVSLFFFQMEQKPKKRKVWDILFIQVPSSKYGYVFDAPLKSKETQAVCSLRRLNRASLFCACVKHAKCSVNAAFAFVFEVTFSVWSKSITTHKWHMLNN